MADLRSTQYFKVNAETDIAVKDILEAVYIALTEKGYWKCILEGNWLDEKRRFKLL